MTRKSKRFKEINKVYDVEKIYTINEAVEMLKKFPSVKFDQSVEISLKLGIDPKKNEQQVRGTVPLPNGTGKSIRIVVFAKGEMAIEAEKAGADVVGSDDLFKKINKGWTDFDAMIATPDMMREVGKLGKVLGPRGLMPSPKAGTVTKDVSKAVQELKAGKIEFKNNKSGMINNAVGKLSFDANKITENVLAFISAVQRVKPATAKGKYIKSLVLSSTMGPGIKIDIRDAEVVAT